MKIDEIIFEATKSVIKELYGEEVKDNLIQIQPTRKEFEGDRTIVVFPLLRASKKSPEETAQELGTALTNKLDEVVDFNVIKGFLNLVVSNKFWLEFFSGISSEKNFGFAVEKKEGTIMVEYSSPNTNKPLHLGHLRNNFLGYSVAEILKANGQKVVKTQIINDRGIHICKSMLAWQKFGEGETPESAGIKGDKLVGKYYVEFDKNYKKQIAELVESGQEKEVAAKNAPLILEAQDMLRKWEAKDPEVYKVWETMNGWVYEGFSHTYKVMGVDFDKLYYESDTFLLGRDEVTRGLEMGVFFKKEDGSVWCDLTKEGLDEKLVLRADGTAVYMTQDIGTAIERYKDYPDLEGIIYTVGNEQDYHFKVLFLILNKLEYKWAEHCSHLSYGMVDLPSGKMKSREGTVVDADELMQEMFDEAEKRTSELGKLEGVSEQEKKDLFRKLGLGALKYFILKVDPKKRMMFNPEESIDFQGNTGPFIQYAHARICSILRKAGDLNCNISSDLEISSSERELVKTLYDFPQAIKEAGDDLSPAVIANYTYELVRAFNHLYQSVSILKEENEDLKNFRLNLCNKVGEVISSSMGLLGVEVPERM